MVVLIQPYHCLLMMYVLDYVLFGVGIYCTLIPNRIELTEAQRIFPAKFRMGV